VATKTDKTESAPETGGRADGGRGQLAEPVGEGLRKHRQEAGVSLRALAREVGVSLSLISQIEHGKATPSVATLYAIVSELDISLDELFFDNPRGAAAAADPAPQPPMDPGNERAPSSHWRAPSEGPVLRTGNRLSLTLATGVRFGNASPPPTTPASSSSTAPTRWAASRPRPTT
jgi:transcriptional regulator with XRE-family HTH domain